MRAVIWAGGFGTRLRPITLNRQKCMVDVAGKPCLERIVEKLEAIDIKEIVVKVHYKKDQVIEHFGERVLYYYQKELLDEDESLAYMERWLWDDYTIVINGDTLSDVDIQSMFTMAKGKNIRHMDRKKPEIFAGTKILTPEYWKGNKKFNDFFSEEKWFDIGTFNGLYKAHKHYHDKEKSN